VDDIKLTTTEYPASVRSLIDYAQQQHGQDAVPFIKAALACVLDGSLVPVAGGVTINDVPVTLVTPGLFDLVKQAAATEEELSGRPTTGTGILSILAAGVWDTSREDEQKGFLFENAWGAERVWFEKSCTGFTAMLPSER
jgi:hypothetical protein